MRPLLVVGLTVALLATAAAAAGAWWSVGGTGTGTAAVADMPTGQTPSVTVNGGDLTVSWSQSPFASGLLGSLAGGGYRVARFLSGSGVPIDPGPGCAGVRDGAGATLSCVETGVAPGTWRYAITPVLSSFTGARGSQSLAVDVLPEAPILDPALAVNPTTAQTTGDVELDWSAVAGADGYDVFRRTAAGSYDDDAPLNGATPTTATSWTDPGSGLAAGATYAYVVRTVDATPELRSVRSTERSVTPVTRPAAPAGAITATAVAAARVDVGWSAVAGAAGYDVFRRTTAGSFDYGAPLNGATPVTATSWADTTAVDGTAYRYVVRTVITGTGGAPVQSADSATSAAVTADGTAPPAATLVSSTAGGGVADSTCGFVAGTRYVRTSVTTSTTMPSPESGQTLVITATTPGSSPVETTVAAPASPVAAVVDLSSLLDGAVTLTVRTQDVAGNRSAATTLAGGLVKDTVAPSLTAVTYVDRALLVDRVTGATDCGVSVRAVETAPNAGSFSLTTTASGLFTLDVDSATLANYAYSVTATDLAGNVAGPVALSGFAVL